MFRRKKKKGAEQPVEPVAAVEGVLPADEGEGAPASPSESPPSAMAATEPLPVATATPPESTSPPIDASEEQAVEHVDRGQFRSWVVDNDLGYSRLTDEKNRLIVLQFSEKPAEDVLIAVKTAGFYYKPEHDGQKSVWVRRNDFEGRVQVESLEKVIRGQTSRETASL